MHLLKQEHSTKVQIRLSANTSTSDMRCRKNGILNTRCGCISASPAFDPGGKINHLFEKTTTTKKKKEKKRQQLLLLSSLTRTRLTRGEGRRVIALSRCMTCRSGIKILKPASQVSMWINGIFKKFEFDQRRRVCGSKWSKRPITGARTVGSVLNRISRRDKWQLTSQLDPSVNSQENIAGSCPRWAPSQSHWIRLWMLIYRSSLTGCFFRHLFLVVN